MDQSIDERAVSDARILFLSHRNLYEQEAIPKRNMFRVRHLGGHPSDAGRRREG